MTPLARLACDLAFAAAPGLRLAGLCAATAILSGCEISSETQLMNPADQLGLSAEFQRQIFPETADGGYADFTVADGLDLLIISSYGPDETENLQLERPLFSVAFYPLETSSEFLLLETQYSIDMLGLLRPAENPNGFFYGLGACDNQGALAVYDMNLSALGDTLHGSDRTYEPTWQTMNVTTRAALLEIVTQAVAERHYIDIEPDGDIDPFLGAISCADLFADAP